MDDLLDGKESVKLGVCSDCRWVEEQTFETSFPPSIITSDWRLAGEAETEPGEGASTSSEVFVGWLTVKTHQRAFIIKWRTNFVDIGTDETTMLRLLFCLWFWTLRRKEMLEPLSRSKAWLLTRDWWLCCTYIALYNGLSLTHSHTNACLLPYKVLLSPIGSHLGPESCQRHNDGRGGSKIWTANPWVLGQPAQPPEPPGHWWLVTNGWWCHCDIEEQETTQRRKWLAALLMTTVVIQ